MGGEDYNSRMSVSKVLCPSIYYCVLLLTICSSALARDPHALIHSSNANFWRAKSRYLIPTSGHMLFLKSNMCSLRPIDT
jgi:hypothetical protein